jgi:sugar-specific transcriptional regulator TrmB
MDIKTVLQNFGLTESEAQVYIILLRNGDSNASEVAAKSNIHRINVYDILERLQEKGLISYIIKGKTKYYEAANPKRILQMENDKRENIKKIIPELEELRKLGENPQEATIYKDRAGVLNIIDEHTHSKTEVYMFGSGWGLKQNFPDYYDVYHARLARNKVKAKILLSNKSRGMEIPKNIYEARYLPSEFIVPSSTAIYEDKILMIMWSEQPMAILIRGKEVSKSYKHYFELLWKIAKP